jgi:hypothetical protein
MEEKEQRVKKMRELYGLFIKMDQETAEEVQTQARLDEESPYVTMEIVAR